MMWRTLWKDFMEQPIFMKLFVLWAWLCVIIMLGALLAPHVQSILEFLPF